MKLDGANGLGKIFHWLGNERPNDKTVTDRLNYTRNGSVAKYETSFGYCNYSLIDSTDVTPLD